MITQESIKKLSGKFRTREENVAREYIQNLFLSSLYQLKNSEKILFKGGTALRIIYQSPRFSEDLDFSSINFNTKQDIENIFITIIEEIEKVNINLELKEAKFTSGGYLGIIAYDFYHFKGEIFFEVSFREKKIKAETDLIVNDYVPSYILTHLSSEELVKEKVSALLERGKPRDYYDIYFILRHPELKQFIHKKILLKIEQKLQKEKTDFKRELSVLLPIDHNSILKGFQERLIREICKYK